MKRFFTNLIVYAVIAIVASCGIIIPLRLFAYNQSRMTNRIDAKAPETVVEPINISNINSSDMAENAEDTKRMSFDALTYKVWLYSSGYSSGKFSTTEYGGVPKDMLPNVYETIERLSNYLPLDAQMWENSILTKFNTLELLDINSNGSGMFVYEITFMRFREKTKSILTMAIDAETYMVYSLFLKDELSESVSLPFDYYKDILSNYELSEEEQTDLYTSQFPSYDNIQVSANCSIGQLMITYTQTNSDLTLSLSCDTIPYAIIENRSTYDAPSTVTADKPKNS